MGLAGSLFSRKFCMASTVLFVGDVNVDLNFSGLKQNPVPDKEIQASGFEVVIGSSAAIAAVAHASLGGKTAFVGLAGDDEYGRFMKTKMSEAGVDVAGIRLKADLRTGVTVNLVAGQTRTQVTYPGAIPRLRPSFADFTGFKDLRHVHFAGIYQQTDLLPELSGLIGQLKKTGVTVSVDPQWDESEKWLFADQWLGLADVVFVNADEALSLSGNGTLGDAIEALSARCTFLIVKSGAGGAVLREAGKEYRVAGHRVDLVDSIGAGDNFAAGFLFARLEKGLDLPSSLSYANAAAARSCCFSGGTGARSQDSDIVHFLEETK